MFKSTKKFGENVGSVIFSANVRDIVRIMRRMEDGVQERDTDSLGLGEVP